MPNLACIVVGAQGTGQDRASIFEVGDACVIALADGAGGLGGGDKAAEAVIADVKAAIDEGLSLTSVRPWIPRLHQLDRRLAGLGESTTIVTIIQPGRVLGVSVGDSDAWLMGLPGGLAPRRLTARQQKLRLGSTAARITPFDDFCRAGALVIGSDGLWNYLPVERAQEIVLRSPPEEAARELIAAVRLPSRELRDDVSVVVARLGEGA